MTIPSEAELIQIERRADLLEALADRLDEISEREWKRGDDATTEFEGNRFYAQSTETSKCADVVRKLASDVPSLLFALRELRTGGRVSSAR